jgi:hypothetical protein
MNNILKIVKPTSVFPVIMLLLVSLFYQSASAAMIGTERLLKSDRNQETRDYLHYLITRQDVQEALVARGISPHEAKARIDSLTDDEIELVSKKIANLPAGGDATGFIVIVGVVIIILIIIVEWASQIKQFSLTSNN